MKSVPTGTGGSSGALDSVASPGKGVPIVWRAENGTTGNGSAILRHTFRKGKISKKSRKAEKPYIACTGNINDSNRSGTAGNRQIWGGLEWNQGEMVRNG